ncbi:Ig-like domain-containing protein [Hyalangium rubrum]|uniref:Ig-like domain-containing protein n=1 Tax=Hyalangium rubrum TaxID=3103134 RepID=A0ABU5GXY1_9BACT|nr:Ig-like domain-containing protein [Hyalangium sp. s54d21]MDY7225554.1 Ig-like domain-containing protein [Hyalangium sp. s54d21]
MTALALFLLLAAGCGTNIQEPVSSSESQLLIAVCGDGIFDPGETCDDGNTVQGDGCSPTCAIEVGYVCSGAPSVCNTVCGDGQLVDAELCDDGNTTAGDGCSASCTIEPGYGCTGYPSVCAVACGDGIKASTEACDDGNTNAGDGCSATCTVEPGATCQTPPVSAFFTRRGIANCTQVENLPTPPLPPGAVQPSLSTPARYRVRYVSGAVSYSSGANWYPGIIGINYTNNDGGQAFSIGFNPPLLGFDNRNDAINLGFTLFRDFDAVSGSVSLALIDVDCPSVNNSDNAVNVRLDAISVCQQTPVITSTPTSTGPGATIGGTAVPGASVQVFLDGSTTPLCTVTADASGQFTCPAPGLSEGTHTAVATSTIVGNSATSAPVTFTLDSVPPAAPVITGPTPNQVLTDTTPTITGTAEIGSTVTVYIDGSTTPACTAVTNASGVWSCDVGTALPEGPHTVTATATDTAGNTSQQSNTVPFTIDTAAPPSPTITGPTPGQVLTDTTPTITGTAEPGSTVTVYIDGSTTPACTAVANASGVWSCDVGTPLPEGPHTVTATATDDLGNTSPPTSPVPFTIDISAPAAPVITGPTPNQVLTDTTPTITGTAEIGSTVTVYIDGSTTPACTAVTNASGVWSCDVGTALAQGPHTVTATATDAGGNTSPPSNTVPFSIDTQAPAAPVITGPTPNQVLTDTTPTITGTAEAGATVTVYIDGSTTPACTAVANSSGVWSCDVGSALAEGPHTVTATATDTAGNTSPQSNTVPFTIDTQAPTAPTITGPTPNQVLTDNTPTITGTAEPGSTVTVYIDGSTTPACTAVANSSGVWSCDVGTPLPEGPHTVTATATDGAGNTSPPTSAVPFTIDTSLPSTPVITGPTPNQVLTDTTPTITGTATPGNTVNVYIDGSTTPACTAVANASGVWSCDVGTPLSQGPHTVTATATDGLGNTSPPSNTVPFTIDTEAPTAPVITGPTSGQVVGDNTPTITGTAEPGATVTVYIDGSTTPACTAVADASGNWSCEPTTALPDGPHTVTATATDPAGNTSPPSNTVPFTVDTSVPNLPPAPVITGPTSGQVVGDNTPPITGTATPGSTVNVYVDGGTTPVCTAVADASGNWSCEPSQPLPDGPHTITATETDGAGNTSPPSNAVSITIDTVPPETTITRGPPASTTSREAEFEFSSNEPGVRYECSLDGGAFGPCEDSYTVGVGEHTLRVRAIDAAGNVDPTPAEHKWTVTEGGGSGSERSFGGGGCSAAPFPAAWLAMMVVAAIRRRSRR